jgi:hypothetical protein
VKRALIIAALALVAVPVARADGLPVLGIDVGGSGVAAAGGDSRYVTMPATANGTVVARVRRFGGQVLRSRLLVGTFTIPAVAYDRSAGGLSGDRRRLVLIEPRQSFPRQETTLLVLNAPTLETRATVHLNGDFSFDAVSPDGQRLFLIQYTSPSDATRYLVRAYDIRSARLLSQPIVDPHERGDKMRGNPLSRATSSDGRWAYTLYDGAGGAPFVHALDTVHTTARCIDLDQLVGLSLSRMRLRMDDNGGTVAIRDGGRTLLDLDTRTFALAAPAQPSSSAFPLAGVALAVAAALLLCAAAAAGVLRRRRRSGSGAGLEPYQSVGR